MKCPDRHLLQSRRPSGDNQRSAHWCDRSKLFRMLVGKIPGAESAHTVARKVNSTRIYRVFAHHLVDESDNRLGVSPVLHPQDIEERARRMETTRSGRQW